MSAKLLCRAAACTTLSLLTPALWALPSLYHLDDIGRATQGTDVNRSGKVSGNGQRGDVYQAFRWSGGTQVYLDNPHGGWSHAEAINNAGAVVGWVSTPGYDQAAVWRSPGVLEEVGTALGALWSAAGGINEQGDCTIDATLDNFREYAYYIPGCVAENAIDIGSLGAGGTYTTGINANGQIAGTSSVKGGRNGQRAYLYTDGHMKNLGVLSGDTWSEGRGLNGHGHVVGRSVHWKGGNDMAFLYDGRKMRKLGTLGGPQSVAYQVNDFDVVVGTAQLPSRIWHAFVFDKGAEGTTMKDLQTMLDASGAGWNLSSATAINNNGQILAKGLRAGDISERAVLLTPVP